MAADERLTQAAALLRQAYRKGPVEPLRGLLDAGDGASAYRVQAINTELWVREGRRIVGQKVGLTARAVREQMGVDQPDFGILFDDMQIPDDGVLDSRFTFQPRAEAEIAFVMAADVADGEITPDAVAKSVDHAVVAIEIVDSRIVDWRISFADTVADNGSSAFFVLGSDRRTLTGLDLWTCGMALEIDGEVVAVGAGAACLGHPLNALAWLARTAVATGRPLRAGDIVLSGALGPMAPFRPGQSVRATLGGLGSCGYHSR